jgi:hypothetical protein
MREPLPLATIQDALLEFLRGRDDAVLFGAHAVNAYVEEPRMPKGDTDRRDLKMLLLAHPQLKTETGLVSERLREDKADPRAIDEWRLLVASTILPENDDDGF